MRRRLAAALLLALAAARAEAAPRCPDGTRRAVEAGTSRCVAVPPPPKIEPYDPDRARAGSRPGFIDLGGGTEVRVGGRAVMEFETKR